MKAKNGAFKRKREEKRGKYVKSNQNHMRVMRDFGYFLHIEFENSYNI